MLALAACSSDEPKLAETPKFEGDQAMMVINIFSPDNFTRSGEDDSKIDGDENDYEVGDEDENKVYTLDFYFYNNLGDYATTHKSTVITDNEGNSSWGFTNSPDPLTGKVGSAKIVLDGLSGTQYPSYMIAIINAPTSLDLRNKSMKKASEELLGLATENTGNDGTPWNNNRFIMTSATHSDNLEECYFFASKLETKNFAVQGPGDSVDQPWNPSDTPENAGVEAVNIYVERLAAKVDFKLGSALLSKCEKNQVDLNDASKGYYYDVTLPGEFDVIDKIETGEDENRVITYGVVKKSLKVRLFGWGLNGRAKKMRFFKAVNSNPNAFKTNDGWVFDGTNRCYWGKAPGYGENNLYPKTFGEVTNKSGKPETGSSDTDIDAADRTLNYISWNEATRAIENSVQYVMPHTEIGAQLNLSGNNLRHSAVTEVLISAQILDSSNNPITLYQFGDTYYTEVGFKNHFINAIGSSFWKKTDDTHSKTMEVDDLTIGYGYDGTFTLSLANSSSVWYKDSNCSETNKWINSDVVKILNDNLPNKQSYCYKEGRMYYNIPIKHLRPYSIGEEIKTGMFGIVRNHWYQVTVTDIKKLGNAVYRPDEDIIPNSDGTQYMIGSSINILSWRLVPQETEL